MSSPEFKNPVVKWIDHRLPVFSFMHHELHEYPTPRNLSYLWNLGSLAGLALVTMIVTGIILAMHYTPHVDHAFESVERIMRDVNHGWLIRYIHMNGASFFFIVVYIHIFRGLYYGSYKAPRELLWILGVLILLLMTVLILLPRLMRLTVSRPDCLLMSMVRLGWLTNSNKKGIDCYVAD